MNYLLTFFFVGLTFAACSSTRPLEQCDDPSGDCCSDNEQCLRYFGSDYPFCAVDHCVQCTSDEHCAAGEVCIEEADVGYFCGLE